MTDPIEAAKASVSVVGELIKAAGENPHAKEAGRNLGHAALTISKTINNALLPLAAINFGFEKARKYFDERFVADLSSKVNTIPQEHIVEPKPSIAGPALQGLAFTHDEPTLREMYLSLLANAMDDRFASGAHPAFVEIIRQLDSIEAGLLRGPLTQKGIIAIARPMVMEGNRSLRSFASDHIVNFRNTTTMLPLSVPRLSSMVDNWVRLGLVSVDYTSQVDDGVIDAYEWFENCPEVFCLRKDLPPNAVVRIEKGVLAPTSLGRHFAQVVGMK